MKNIIKKILSISMVICLILNMSAPAFAVSDIDMLRSMIRQIGQTDIMNDEAVLSIGNDIERANELYNALSSADKSNIPSAESSVLEAYVGRMSEILSMRMWAASPRAATGNTYIKNGVAYYEHDGFYARGGPAGSANVYLGGKMYIRTSNTTDTCKSTSCVLSEHSNMHNKSITNYMGVLLHSSQVANLFGLRWHSGTPIGQLGLQFSDMTSEEDETYATSSLTFHYGTQSLYIDRWSGTAVTTNEFIGNLRIVLDPHSARRVTGDVNVFLANGGYIEANLWSQYFPYTANVIIAKDSSVFDNTPPTQPTITAKPVARYYVAPMELEDNTQNGVEFLGYSTREEVEQDKKDRAERKVLSENTFEHDVLYKLIKNISRTDIMNDEAVLSIGNEIERAFEIYSSLSAEQQNQFPSTESSVLEAYVRRITEILSMNKLRSASPRVSNTLPEQMMVEGVLYYKDTSSFTYTYRTSTVWQELPLNNVVAYTRFNSAFGCKLTACDIASHQHNKKVTRSRGLAATPVLDFYANTASAGNDGWFFLSYENTDDENGKYKHDSSAIYTQNGIDYPLVPGTTIGSNYFYSKGYPGADGVGLRGNVQNLFDMGGLLKVYSNYAGYNQQMIGEIRAIFGIETAFDTIAPTVPNIETKKVTRYSISSMEAVETYGVEAVTSVKIDKEKVKELKDKKLVLSDYIDIVDNLNTLMKKIKLVDIKNDEAVLSIGNEIEKAHEMYNKLSADEQLLYPSDNRLILEAYVRRITEILSMNKLRSASPRAISDLPDTMLKDGILYFKMPTSFMYRRKDKSTDTWTRNIPLNIVAYSRYNSAVCTSLICSDSAHRHSMTSTHSGGMLPNNSLSPLILACYINGMESNPTYLIKTGDWGDDWSSPPSNWTSYASASYVLNSATYPITDGTIIGSNKFYRAGSSGWSGVAMLGDLKQLFDMGGLMKVSSTFNTNYSGNMGTTYAMFGIEAAFDTSPPTVPTISLAEKLKQVLSATLDWFSDDVEITIGGSTDTGGSGLKGYEYQIDGGAWTAYTAPFTVSASCNVNARASDNAGNLSTTASKAIKIDKIAPTAPSIVKSPTREFANSDVTITITHGTDSQSGVAKSEYQINGSAWTTYTVPFIVGSTATVNVRTVDNVGNISPVSTTGIKIDRDIPTAPVITKSPSGEFANTNVNVTIDDSTDTGGSGLKGYEYQIDSGAWTTYTVPLVVSSTVTINARSTDNAENISTLSVEEVKIDKVAPSAPSIVKSPTREFANDDVSVIIVSSTDDYSGVNCTEYQIDGGAWTTYTAPLVISSTSSIKARTTDNANNISTVSSEVVKIDRAIPTAPVITKSPSGEFANTDVTVTIDGSTDTGGSSLNGYEYQTNGGAWTTYTVPLTITSTVTINARASDNAENISSVSSEEVKIDKVAPSAPSIVKSPTREFANSDVTVVVSHGVDDNSGVNRTEYQIDGGAWQTYTEPIVISTNANINARTTDNANNISTVSSEVVKIDRAIPTAPVITKSPTNEFASDDVTVTIDGSTDTGGSGLKGYEYQTNGGAWTTYTVPLTITSTVTINARASDNAENISSVSSEEIKIDRTAPTFYLEKTPDDWTNGDVTINVQVSDNYSGIKSFAMTSPSAISVPFSTDFITTTSASFVVSNNDVYSFIATNHAGLSVEFDTTVDKIEDLPPTPPKQVDGESIPPDNTHEPEHIEKDWGNTPIDLPLTSDASSGIKKFQYILENSSPSPFKRTRNAMLKQSWIDYDSTVFKVVSEGVYTLKVRSVSNAGNISDVSTYLIRNDYTAPTATHTFEDSKAIITTSDTLSGVAKISCIHGDTSGSITTCEVVDGTTHDYKIYDTAGNILGYSVNKAVIPPPPPPIAPPTGGTSDRDYEYEYPSSSAPTPSKEEPKKDIPIKPVTEKPVTGEVKLEGGESKADNSNTTTPSSIKPPNDIEVHNMDLSFVNIFIFIGCMFGFAYFLVILLFLFKRKREEKEKQ